MTEPELRLALSLALAEVERLRDAQATLDVARLRAEATQAHVMLLAGASHLAKRAPLVAEQLRHRADRLKAAMP